MTLFGYLTTKRWRFIEFINYINIDTHTHTFTQEIYKIYMIYKGYVDAGIPHSLKPLSASAYADSDVC
jgi:hypothetical protein